MRTLTQFLAGHHPGPDAAISKLYWSEYHQVVTELAVDILGADALVPDRPPAVVARSRPTTPGAPNSTALVGRHVPQRPGRHDLRRHVADPAQHHRRDGARPAQGARAPTPARGPSCSRTGSESIAAVAAPPVACGRRRCVSGRGSCPRGWWRRPPFLPVPDRAYLALPAADAVRRPRPPTRAATTWSPTSRGAASGSDVTS